MAGIELPLGRSDNVIAWQPGQVSADRQGGVDVRSCAVSQLAWRSCSAG
jgi:hypothetical protein